MRVHPNLLCALLLIAAVPVAHASPSEAASWTPPAFVPARSAEPSAPPVAPPVTASETLPEPPPAPVMATAEPAAAESAVQPVRATRKARRACRPGKARCKPRPPKLDPRLIAARTQRDRLLAVAQPMAAAGRAGDAARMLGGAAEAQADPVLYVAAAEAELADPHVDSARLTRAIHLAQEAQRLVAAPIDLRVTDDEGNRVTTEAQDLAGYAKGRLAQLRQVRQGKAQLTAGTTFLVLGASGIGVLLSGAVLSSRVDSARDAYTGQDAPYLAALDGGKDRAGTLLAAGAVSAIIGAAIGIPLTLAGSRDLKRARGGARERPSFRFAPGLAAVSVSGRF